VARPEKTQAVAEITERFNESDAVILTEYRGLRVGEIAEVRGALRGADTDYKVLKNTLARIAVREVGLEELVDMLEGPTAVAFIKGDAVEAAKALDDAAKKYPVLVIKGGVMQGKIIDADQARALAKLEPREVQLAKIVMMVNTPLQQTANVLSALLRDFGSMLAQVVAQKESEAPAAEVEAPAAAAEAEAPAAETSPDAGDATPESTDAGTDATPESTEGTAEEAAPAEDETPEAAADDAPAAEAETPPVEEETVENPDVGPAPEATEESTDATEEEGKE
jgi:large subunit ribosomal protein L10